MYQPLLLFMVDISEVTFEIVSDFSFPSIPQCVGIHWNTVFF